MNKNNGEDPYSGNPAANLTRRESRSDFAVLADRSGYFGTPGTRWLGYQGGRPIGRRFAGRVPRFPGFLSRKSLIYESIRRGLAGQGNCPTGRWTIALGSEYRVARDKRSGRPLWYAEAAFEHGWSRPVLAAQIDIKLHGQQGQAVTNFSRVLPPETSDLAQQVLKDPYHFDFLTLRQPAHEREIERALIGRIKDLLLELGKGFSFIGS